MQPCLTKRNSNPIQGLTSLIFVRGTAWPNGSTLKVGFLNGDQAFQQLVMQAYADWSKVANLKFQQVANPYDADIRVIYNPSGGNWSKLGTGARSVSNDKPTMNISDVEYATIAHEAGHSIGFDHEHKSPNGGIKWNKPAVIEELSGPPNNWSTQDINFNLFDAYSQDQVNGSSYDSKSIMHYPIKASWTTNGYSVGYNREISAQDKEWAQRIYPFDGSASGGENSSGDNILDKSVSSVNRLLPENSLWIVGAVLLMIWWWFNKKKLKKRSS